MANTKSNVSAGKPKVSGAIFRAPLGTDLPTSTAGTLAADFVNLGYISEDGVTKSASYDNQTKAWGGDIIFADTVDTFEFTLIESMNVDVLKAVYGDDAVTGALATGITVSVSDAIPENASYVIDMMLAGNVADRIVIPSAGVQEKGDVVYRDSEAIAYPITLKASADETGHYHYEYIKAPSTSSGG